MNDSTSFFYFLFSTFQPMKMIAALLLTRSTIWMNHIYTSRYIKQTENGKNSYRPTQNNGNGQTESNKSKQLTSTRASLFVFDSFLTWCWLFTRHFCLLAGRFVCTQSCHVRCIAYLKFAFQCRTWVNSHLVWGTEKGLRIWSCCAAVATSVHASALQNKLV